ncbi:SOUL heme-binding protein [Anaerohalosphaera lusitana]|uniref:SOUL heme-binding protein n=1 Tax=Anaerohalosphaera lusitana TaxID=1936003 RepID=A0A1U9NIE5_9BACT|nr:heme-binding protein [Anaerohalosphaera lusitana]AQT67712.1 SOUL heme-binding protein [Anaerohalosphaera lusitana]
MGFIGKTTGLLGGIAVALGLAGCAVSQQTAYTNAGSTVTKGEVIEEIEKAVDGAEELKGEGETGAARDELAAKAQELGSKLGSSDAGYVLSEAAREEVTMSDEQAFDYLKRRMETAVDALKFEANVSADLPEGWPEPSMVGLVRLKKYPVVRMVKAEGADQGETFGVLFSHIKEREIPMTAPVQMDYEAEGEGMRMEAMSFYYPSEEVGTTGQADQAVVFDSEPMKVVSVAVKGAYNKGTYEPAVEKLKAWLEEQDKYEAVGGVRVLGYNGPFTPWWMKYSEVQIPVSEKR